MAFIVKFLGMAMLATALGLASAWWAIDHVVEDRWIANGPWRINTLIGSPEADPYTRAAVALTGLLALDRRQAVYFAARRDSAGAPLDADCAYTVAGRALPGRWWSLTAYGADGFLIPGAAGRYSVTAAAAGPGDWRVAVAREPDPSAPLALPLAEAEDFTLLLRLYGPEDRVLTAPGALDLPRIERGACT